MLRLLSEATRPLRMLNVRWLMLEMMDRLPGQLSQRSERCKSVCVGE
jgi:hypothetical protein